MNWRLVIVGTLLAAVVDAAPLSWQSANGVRVAHVTPNGTGQLGFTMMSAQHTGITFSNFLSEERGLTNQIYYSASGVACGDVDGDGWVDVYLCSLNGDNRLYRNLGDWKFSDVTEAAKVRCPDQPSTGCVFVDVDGDGDLDLLVSSIGHGVRLFLNDAHGVFTETTTAAGLASDHASMTMTLADIDGDGDLDLYVANYRRDTFQDQVNVRFRVRNISGRPQVVAVNDRPAIAPDLTNRYYLDARGTVHENAEADVLYLNDGRGNFSAVSWTNGTFLDNEGHALTAAPLDWGLSAIFRDLDGDGAPDLYVCNDGESPDRIWLNDGQGKFREPPPLMLRETSFSSMGVDFADINRDGFDDFFVADMLGYEHASRQTLMGTRAAPLAAADFAKRQAVPRNTLFLNRGDKTFSEIAQLAGVEASDWSWCPVFLDVDLDGYEDLLITTGLEKSLRNADERMRIEALRRQGRLTQEDFVAVRRRMTRLDVPNFAFRNRGDLTFENASVAWHFDSHASSHGIALADLDNDGDMDVVVNCLNAPPLLYRNDVSSPRLAVKLHGTGPNTRGIGAKISVRGAKLQQSQQMISGGRYLSSDDAMRVFAAGAMTNALSIEVHWRSGRINVVSNLLANSIVEVSETKTEISPQRTVTNLAPLFSDVSARLNYRHEEQDIDEFARQPMLPRRLSNLGPGVAWLDFNDGDALVVGAGQGSELRIFTNTEARFFSTTTLGKAADDIGGIVCWDAGQRTNFIAFSQSTLKSGGTNAVFVWRRAGAEFSPVITLPSWSASPGAISAADVDGDGDIDLFVAGRGVPGNYPAAAMSRIFRNDHGAFILDERLSKPFQSLGLVNGAVFTDLGGDGKPELVLACEWDAIRVFRFSGQDVIEITKELHVDRMKGWWQGITAGDFDGDGRMDIVASNWGRNHRYSRFSSQPVRIYYGDVDGDGTMECVEAYYDPALKKYVPTPRWDSMAFRFPFLQQRIRSFAEFSTMSVEEILGDQFGAFRQLSANLFDSAVLLNRGDHFENVPLPIEAQFAPAFGVCVADFDGDGHEDVFLAQNFSGTDSETSRLDAGRGLMLLGDGRGSFRALSAHESGIALYGDGRGAAASDFDRDGRVDLCVGQNGADAALFHNERARPGLRVRLRGTSGNASGIGAVLRAVFDDASLSPAREVHAGSGWLSQDSAVQVLARPKNITAVEVRWPNGRKTTAPVLKDAAEILVESTR